MHDRVADGAGNTEDPARVRDGRAGRSGEGRVRETSGAAQIPQGVDGERLNVHSLCELLL